MHRLLWMGALALLFGLLGSVSDATAAYYGNYSGTTVSFLDVQDVNGLYGAPTASGDSLDFSPNTFEADCALSGSCPPTPHQVDDNLTFQIDANPGYFIEQIELTEAGDTTLSSFLNAYGATTVTGDVFVDVLQVNGNPVNNVNGNAQMVFTSGGTYNTNDEGSGTHLWSGYLIVDVDALIASAALTGRATLVEVSLINVLDAYAESGAAARIEKKDVDGLAITVIPEPGTALLMGLGLLGLASRRTSRHP